MSNKYSFRFNKRTMFTSCISAISGDIENTTPEGTVTITADEMRAFLQHEIDLINSKTGAKSKKALETQEENSHIAQAIVGIATEPMTVTDITRTLRNRDIGDYTLSKITSILTNMKREGIVYRTEVKGKPYYQAV